jgi:hypothetical protein
MRGLLDQAEHPQVDISMAARRRPWWVVIPVIQVR